MTSLNPRMEDVREHAAALELTRGTLIAAALSSQLTWISDAFLAPVTLLELSFGALGDLFGRAGRWLDWAGQVTIAVALFALLFAVIQGPTSGWHSGQVIGLGGDRLALWSHPAEAVVAFAEGGWSADAIAQAWPEQFDGHQQTVGQQFLEPN